MSERVTPESVLAAIPSEVWRLPRDQMAATIARATKYNPLLFALWYFPHHLRDDADSPISFSRFHVDLARRALRWTQPNKTPMAERDADIAPRESGKSTWKFLILPAWGAAHEWIHFCAAFADSGPQAEMHLSTFKKELETNALLQQDFEKLCQPSRRHTGVSDSDTKSMYIARNGFVFAAKGIDSKSLGMKVGDRRPDLILLDDIEPDGANYSDYQKGQRLATLQNSILPLAVKARVELSGTVTMPGSITHDLVKSITSPNEPVAPWVIDERFRVHHYDALITDELTGQRVSMWPEKWATEFLLSIEHTRSYRLNYANDPLAMDGTFWTSDDIRHGTTFQVTRTILSIDPAVTDGTKSDFTGLAVIGGNRELQRCRVRGAWQVKLPPGEPLRLRVMGILREFPDIVGILVESNQGGGVWEQAVFHDMPVKVATVHNSEPKEWRATELLTHYQMSRVEHEREFPAAEQQLIGFPKGHDDIVDAIGNGVNYFLGAPAERRKTSTQSYVGG